jgi:hypothetical protein
MKQKNHLFLDERSFEMLLKENCDEILVDLFRILGQTLILNR